MNPSIFENAMKKSHYTDLEKRKHTFGYRIGLVFRAKIEHFKLETLPKGDKRLPHLHFKYKSSLVSSYEPLNSYEINAKEKEIKTLVDKLNGLIIKPNSVFSFWKNVGYTNFNYTKESTFDSAHLTSQKIKGTTPAICQVSNMLYWIALHSPLEITERHRHDYDLYPDHSRNRPFGTGATCIYNLYDLKFQNRTDSIFQIVMTYKEDTLHGELRSLTLPVQNYEVYEERHLIKKNQYGNYMRHNTIYRKTTNLKTQKIKIEYITENHALMTYKPLDVTIKDDDILLTNDLKLGDLAL